MLVLLLVYQMLSPLLMPLPSARCVTCAPRGLPITAPVKHRDALLLTVVLGCRYHDAQYPDHTGVDFPVDALTEVHSTLTGRVVIAADDGAWGQLVVVENESYQTWYAHNAYLLARVGDVVARGDLLALSGNTGSSSGPHVHYGVKRRSTRGWAWVNPTEYFDREQVIAWPCRTALPVP